MNANIQFLSYKGLISKNQRYYIDSAICDSYQAALGHSVDAVEYTIRHTAVRGGIRYIDIAAELKGVKREFYVAIANSGAVPYFCDLRARDMYNSYDCGEKHVTLPRWMLTMKAGAWRYRFRRP